MPQPTSTGTSSAVFNASLRAMRHLMFVSGVAPYGYFWDGHNGEQCTRANAVWRCGYFLFVFTAIMTITVLNFEFMDKVTYDYGDRFSEGIDVFDYATLVLVQVIIQMESTWKLPHYNLIFSNFVQIRKHFAQLLGGTFDCVLISRYCLWVYAIFLGSCALLFVVTILLCIASFPLVRMMLAVHAEVVLKLKMFEFILFVVTVMAILTKLQSAGQVYVNDLSLSWMAENPESWQRLCLSRVVVLQKLHAQLWLNVRQIEDYFQWSLAALLIKIFLDMTIMSYWIFLNLWISQTQILKIYCSFIILLKFFSLILACLMCWHCEASEKKIRSLFHNISTDPLSSAYGIYLRNASLQLMHERIGFTAGGCWDFNMNSLGKFAFSVVMFIVILIQFRLTL